MPPSSRSLWALPAAVLAAVLLVLGCRDSATNPSPRNERIPTALRISSPSLSLNDADTARLTVTVLDQKLEPFSSPPPGLVISWSSSNPAVASVSGGLVTANRRGSASIVVSAGQLADSAAVAVRAVASALHVAGDTSFQGTAGQPLRDTLVVRLVDRHQEGVGGVAVEFRVVAGGGTVTPASVTSDSLGFARAFWTLGPRSGPQTVEARAPGVSAPAATFRAAAAPGAASALKVVSGNAQSGFAGRPLAADLSVQVVDAKDNPVVGATTTWIVNAGGGRIEPGTAVTDSSGIARVRWTLGHVTGPQAADAVGGGSGGGVTATA